jgi:hypothetical protein
MNHVENLFRISQNRYGAQVPSLRPRGANQPLVSPTFLENMRFSQMKPLGHVYTHIQLSVGFVTRSRADLNMRHRMRTVLPAIWLRGRGFRAWPVRHESTVKERLPGHP